MAVPNVQMPPQGDTPLRLAHTLMRLRIVVKKLETSTKGSGPKETGDNGKRRP